MSCCATLAVLCSMLVGQSGQVAQSKPVDRNEPEQPIATPVTPPRNLHHISRDLSAWLKAEATASSESEQYRAVWELVRLAVEVRSDPRFDTSETLAEYKARIVSRLRRVRDQVAIRNGVNRRGQNRTPRGAPEIGRASFENSDSGSAGVPATPEATGKPVTSLTARGGGAVPNNAQELIELIENVIAPGFWDTQGGPGAIRYFYPVHALVIRATSEVHEGVGGLVGGLRAAGR